MKFKHKAGKKSLRENYATDIFNALKEGKLMPTSDLNLPPGFIKEVFMQFKKHRKNGFKYLFIPSKVFNYKQ
jgi:hypothetical protein